MSRFFYPAVLAAAFAAVALGCQHDVTMSWMQPSSAPAKWVPAYAAGIVYSVQPGSGVIAIVENTGNILWSTDDSLVVGGPALNSQNLLVVAKAGSIVGLSIADGSVQDQFNFSSSTETPCADGAPVVANGVLYFGTSAGKVYALDANTFAELWVVNLGAGHGVSAPVSLWNGNVIVGTLGGTIFVIAPNGSILNSYTPSPAGAIQTGITIKGNFAIISTNAIYNHFLAVDLTTVKLVWQTSLSEGSYAFSTPIVANGIAYTTTGAGRLHAVDISSGAISWFLELGEPVEVRGPLSIIDGSIVVTSSTASVMGINLATRDVDFWFTFAASGTVRSAVLNTAGLRMIASGSQLLYPLVLKCRS